AGGLEARGNQVFVGCAPRSPLFERLPVNRVPVHVSGRLSPASVGSYLKAMRETKPDVVHVHFSPDFMPAGVAARLAKVELRIMTRHLAIGWQGLKL
ncbi:glycosyltransferase family 4 protein, partial [Glaesserella parasuis]|uniref:glycosyltransferase family 4 protein n=1 Tax=Glaesserella parasuis TaxID=738 RepID=UPI003F3DD97E